LILGIIVLILVVFFIKGIIFKNLSGLVVSDEKPILKSFSSSIPEPMPLVVAEKSRDSLGDVNLINPLTIEKTVQIYPDMSNNKVVWQDYRAGNYNVFLYDTDTFQETQLSDKGKSYLPRIDNNKVVWYSRGDIYLYDIDTKQKTILFEKVAVTPDISDNNVVFAKYETNGRIGIYSCDLTKGSLSRVCKNGKGLIRIYENPNKLNAYPKISGKNIIWKANKDLMFYNLDTKRAIKIGNTKENSYVVSNQYLVWLNNTNSLIFCELDSSGCIDKEVISSGKDISGLSISGEFLVYAQKKENQKWDLIKMDLNSKERANIYSDFNEKINYIGSGIGNNKIIFTNYYEKKYRLF
jgi:beta propeller repeat protein